MEMSGDCVVVGVPFGDKENIGDAALLTFYYAAISILMEPLLTCRLLVVFENTLTMKQS